MKIKKHKGKVDFDWLIEQIVPGKLGDEDRKEVNKAIETYKKKVNEKRKHDSKGKHRRLIA